MKIVLVEDEVPAARHLEALLGQLLPDARVVAVLSSNAAVRDWFATHPAPDLILSDIELADGSAFQTWGQVPPKAPIIFTTAYHQFTLEAFEANGISYLLKPITAEALAGALEKFHRLSPSPPDLTALLTQLNQRSSYKQRLTVRVGQGLYLLKVAELAAVRMKNGVAHAYTFEGKALPLSETLVQLSQLLDPNGFFLINRSELVHIEAIEKVEPYGKDRLAIRLRGFSEALITSAAKTPSFRRWLEGNHP